MGGASFSSPRVSPSPPQNFPITQPYATSCLYRSVGTLDPHSSAVLLEVCFLLRSGGEALLPFLRHGTEEGEDNEVDSRGGPRQGVGAGPSVVAPRSSSQSVRGVPCLAFVDVVGNRVLLVAAFPVVGVCVLVVLLGGLKGKGRFGEMGYVLCVLGRLRGWGT